MNGLKISFAVVAFVLIQGWQSYGTSRNWILGSTRCTRVSKENKKEVIENQVKMKLDLENLIKEVNQLGKDMRKMQSKDKEIVKQNRSIEKQHKDLFKFLADQQTRDEPAE